MGMMGKRIWVAIVMAGFAPTLSAWNETGHRIIAAIAYDHLTTQARARVDGLLRRHPDYESIFVKDAPADAAGRARAAFLVASYWPDAIRNDARFYDESRGDVRPTALQAGFPDMGRHGAWHYVDFNFSEDGTVIPPLDSPNALGELGRWIGVVGTNNALAVYSLPWLIHVAGDVHNPLHTVSRYSRALPKGDRGGNDVWVRPQGSSAGVNLHSYWDGLGGSDARPAYVDRMAAEVAKQSAGVVADAHPETWVVEAFYYARSVAYRFGQGSGSKEQPITLTRAYEASAKALVRERLSTAGMRLAAVLNGALK